MSFLRSQRGPNSTTLTSSQHNISDDDDNSDFIARYNASTFKLCTRCQRFQTTRKTLLQRLEDAENLDADDYNRRRKNIDSLPALCPTCLEGVKNAARCRTRRTQARDGDRRDGKREWPERALFACSSAATVFWILFGLALFIPLAITATQLLEDFTVLICVFAATTASLWHDPFPNPRGRDPRTRREFLVHNARWKSRKQTSVWLAFFARMTATVPLAMKMFGEWQSAGYQVQRLLVEYVGLHGTHGLILLTSLADAGMDWCINSTAPIPKPPTSPRLSSIERYATQVSGSCNGEQHYVNGTAKVLSDLSLEPSDRQPFPPDKDECVSSRFPFSPLDRSLSSTEAPPGGRGEGEPGQSWYDDFRSPTDARTKRGYFGHLNASSGCLDVNPFLTYGSQKRLWSGDTAALSKGAWEKQLECERRRKIAATVANPSKVLGRESSERGAFLSSDPRYMLAPGIGFPVEDKVTGLEDSLEGMDIGDLGGKRGKGRRGAKGLGVLGKLFGFVR